MKRKEDSSRLERVKRKPKEKRNDTSFVHKAFDDD